VLFRSVSKWVSPFAGSTAAVAGDGTIYLAGQNLYAVRPDGTQKWSYPLGGALGSPAVGPGNTIYAAGSPSLHAVSPAVTRVWVTPSIGASGSSSPSLAPDGSIYISSDDVNSVFAISPAGTGMWQASVTLPSDSTAIGADGTIYVTAGALYAFSASGSSLWINHDPLYNQGFAPSPAIGKDGTIYVATSWNFDFGYGFSLYAISPGGTLDWNIKTNLHGGYGLFVSTPTIDSAGIIFVTAHNSLFAIAPGGTAGWTFSPNDGSDSNTSPTIGPDGTIYATFGSKLYAIAWTNGLADSPWPMYRQNPRHTGKVEKPSLQKPKKRSDNNFQFQLFGQISNTFNIEASTNLSTWTSLTSFVATTVPMDVLDLTASNAPMNFYRASTVQSGTKKAR